MWGNNNIAAEIWFCPSLDGNPGAWRSEDADYKFLKDIKMTQSSYSFDHLTTIVRTNNCFHRLMSASTMAQNLTNFTLHSLFKSKLLRWDSKVLNLTSHLRRGVLGSVEKSQGLNFLLLTKGSIFSAPMRRCSYATHYTFAAPYQEDTWEK